MTRVLFVDDEPSYRLILGRMLRREGFTVETAESGQAALGAAKRLAPDVLIVDWMLAGPLDGLQVVASLRQRNPDLRTIVISGYPSAEIEKRVQNLRAARFLAKPFELADLLRAVHELIAEATDGPQQS